MGLHIDCPKDLQRLLKQLKLEVRTVAELQELLAKINADEDPNLAHERLAWRHIAAIGKIACIVAGICSFYGMIIPSSMMHHGGEDPTAITLGILGILWSGAALITLISARIILSALRIGQAANLRTPPEGSESGVGPNTTAVQNETSARATTDIINDMTRIATSRNPS